MTDNMLAEVIESIVESADEIRSQETRSEQDYGKLLAYAEALSAIRDACDSEKLKVVGLDFDIDKRYLY